MPARSVSVLTLVTLTVGACGSDASGDDDDDDSAGIECPEGLAFPEVVPSAGPSHPGPVAGFAMTDDAFYVADDTTIHRATRAATTAEPLVVADQVQSVAADGTGLYYASYDEGSDAVVVHHLDPTNAEDRLLGDLPTRGTGLAIAGDTVYAAGFLGGTGSSGLYALDRTTPGDVTTLASRSGRGDPHTLAVGATHAAWIGTSQEAAAPFRDEQRLWTAQSDAPSAVRFATSPGPLTGAGVAGSWAFTLYYDQETSNEELVRVDLSQDPPVTEVLLEMEDLVDAFSALVADERHLYWLGADGVHRADHDGGGETLVSRCTGFALMQSGATLGVLAQAEDLSVWVHPVTKP